MAAGWMLTAHARVRFVLQGDADDASAAIVRSFRRRIDAVLPAREDAGSDTPTFSVVTDEAGAEEQGEEAS